MRLPKNTATYANYFWTENTGGYCMVDFIELKDKMIIGISDEVICLYKDMDSWVDGDDPIGIIDRPLPNQGQDYSKKQTVLNRIQELSRLVEAL